MTDTRQSFPFLSILTLIFITLKLTGYITWSWLWVLAPLWMPFALLALAFLALLGWTFGKGVYKGIRG